MRMLLIDEVATKKNARDVLNQYRRWARIVGEPQPSFQSVILSDMPKTQQQASYPDKLTVKYLDADIEKTSVDQALKLLPPSSADILIQSYCEPELKTNYEIASSYFWSIGKFESRKSTALLQFSQAYKSGQLEVFTLE